MARRPEALVASVIFVTSLLAAAVGYWKGNNTLVMQALFIALAETGCLVTWAVCSIAAGVSSISDAPQAAEELAEDLRRARERLAQRGFTFTHPSEARRRSCPNPRTSGFKAD